MKTSCIAAWLLTCLSLPLAVATEVPPAVDLPHVLIIGDSISLGYTPYVTKMLKTEAVIKHCKGNAEHTGTGLKRLDQWIGDTDWNVIHFNWGLWDLCYRHPGSKVQGHRDKVNGSVTTSLAQYEKNLDLLVTRLEKTHAKLIWAHTTVVPDHEAGRFVGDDKVYNDAAARVMRKHNIPIDDLYALTRGFAPALFVAPGNVHYTQAGYERIGHQVADVIEATLASPSPRTSDAITQQTLSEVYREARQLARTPGQREQAISRYRSILDIHQANERLVESALRDLAQCYEDAGLTEEHIRFFLTLAYQRQGQERQKVLGEIFNRFERKQPELVQKIVAEFRGETNQEARPRPPVPSQDLVKGILQREEMGLREASLAELRKMLAPASSTEQKQSGLATLRMSLDAKFDREPFLSLVLPLLKSDDDQVRTLTLHCIPYLNASSENLAQIIPLAKDKSPHVRAQVGRVLSILAQGKHPDQTIPVFTALLKDSNREVVKRTLGSMWGQQDTSPELDALIIQLSKDPEYLGTAVYSCLSTMHSKSAPVCRRLIEVMQDHVSKRDDRARAAWGLTNGVVEDAKPLVEAGLLTALPEETAQDARKTGFRALRLVATEKSRPFLRGVLASDMESAEYKQLAQEILQDLDRKTKG